ncbi:sugar kinase [Agrobacterium larrymoorei]|uniref:Sugar kinase n=1 Tax=Agrobacterium larrymoorei TaxID=160699 RepID=A0A4D7DYP5_9HYPH|nr:sugar kinase [Agrobacterium larrymoorei]QCJ00355.1 sugar kinase [Agrobacterium larrymoorei]QYA09200.1 sugar kinase [Agrobacterium larrymoorei]
MTVAVEDENHGKRVLCVGAAVLDTLFRVHDMPTGQGKVLPYEMVQIAEGMASSAAYTVHRMGGRASLWGAVGDDETGTRILRDLLESGIDTAGMTVAKGARSALSTIIIDDRGERLIVPFYDHKLHETKRSCTEADIAPFDAVLVDVRWPELALDVLTVARALGKPAILDGDVAPVETLEKLAPAASHIIFSEPAAERLTGISDVAAMLPVLHQRYPEIFIAVTAGPLGCYWTEAGDPEVHFQSTMKIETVDTLAAGDVFHGTFALAMAEGMESRAAIQLSSVAAALKCKIFGGRIGTPTRAEAEMAVTEWLTGTA